MTSVATEGYEVEYEEPAGSRFAFFDTPGGTEADLREQRVARMLLVGGVAAIGAGIVWWLWSNHRKNKAEAKAERGAV